MKYLAWRVKRFLRGHCPNQKMSCIGKYRRNLINFEQTTHWLLCWQVNLLLDIPFQSFLEGDQHLSKQAKFFIWTAKGVFLNECFIFLGLAIKVPDTKVKLFQPGQFYVRSPILEPRRQSEREAKVRTSVQQQVLQSSFGKQNGLVVVGNQSGSGTQEKAGCSKSRSRSGRAGGAIVHSWNLTEPADPPSDLPCVYDTYSNVHRVQVEVHRGVDYLEGRN